MSQAERDRYAASKPCQECGLPIAACNEIALQRIEIERLRAALQNLVVAADNSNCSSGPIDDAKVALGNIQ